MRTDMIGVETLILVFLAWFIFGAIFLLRKRPPKVEETKRVVAAKWSIALQGAGFALVGSFHRAYCWPFAPSPLGELALAAAAVVVAYASCFFLPQSGADARQAVDLLVGLVGWWVGFAISELRIQLDYCRDIRSPPSPPAGVSEH